MARDLALKTNVEPVDSDYPFGRIKDDDGSGNGTPVDEPVYGDFHQFFAKMFSESGLTYNNLPDNDYSGFQFFEALQENINMYKNFSTYTSSQLIPITDFGKLIFYNSLSSGTFTLPTSNSYALNKKIKIINIGGASANLTITVDSGIISPIGFPTTIILGRYDVAEFVCLSAGIWYLEKIHRKSNEEPFNIIETSTSISLTTVNNLTVVRGSSSSVTIDLTESTNLLNGDKIVILNKSSYPVIVVPSGSDTLNYGASSLTLNKAGDFAEFVLDKVNTNWIISFVKVSVLVPKPVYAFTINSGFFATGTDITLKYVTEKLDEDSLYNTTTGIYTVPIDGYYRVSVVGKFYVVASISQTFTFHIYINGTAYSQQLYVEANYTGGGVIVPFTGIGIVKCVAGDTLEIRLVTGTSQSIAIESSSLVIEFGMEL